MNVMKIVPKLGLILLILLLVGSQVALVTSVHATALAEDDDSNSGDDDSTTSTTSPNDDDNNNDQNDSTGDEEHEDEDDALKEEREVQVEISGDEIQIESELKQGEQKDEIELEIKTSNEIEVELKYKNEVNSTETELEFRVEFRDIIEYLDNGTTNDGYQPETDIIVQRYDIGSHLENDINYTIETVNGSEVHVFSITTTDDVLTVVFRLSESVLNLTNFSLTPNSLKIDVIINDFPYQGNGTSLALMTKVKTKTEVEVDEETIHEDKGFNKTDESEIELPALDNSTSGFFSWAKTAVADETVIQVVHSQLYVNNDDDDLDIREGERSGKLYFSFIAVQPKNIYWDPTIGVLTAPYRQSVLTTEGPSTPNAVPGFEIIGILTILMLGGIAVNRKRRK